MTRIFNYPGGVTQSGTTITPRAPKERKERCVSAPGENNQFSIRKPSKDSPLRALADIYEANGWMTDYVKAPCTCQDWQNKGANAVVVWRGVEHKTFCVCEVKGVA
jgi:hypothetical protein